MSKRLGAIALIFLGASLAWFILGGTLAQRTADSDKSQQDRLSTQWGGSQTQFAPYIWAETKELHSFVIPVTSSRIDVNLNLEQRRDGLLWYNLYDSRFAAVYHVKNTSNSSHLRMQFQLPSSGGNYTNLSYEIGGQRIDNTIALNANNVLFELQPGASTQIKIEYGSRGTDSWIYRFAQKSVESVTDFDLTLTTNFAAIDFPPQTLLPTSETRVGGGYRLEWKYQTLVTSNGIGMTAPTPMQPGPLAQRITFWAPVALLFYLFVMLLITTIRGIDLHPMNYFFIAAAFFAFHLLFAYLVDRIPLEWAFVICSIVSIFLTISYLRLVVGLRFAAVESGLAQLIYLVLFSYALFNEGWSGLTITIGAIVTLFAAMQLTGQIRWGQAHVTQQAG